MPIYTPRGLKIRLDPVIAFALLARLEPTVAPIDVLRTTEAIENAPSLVALLAAVVAIASGAAPWTIFWATLGATTVVATLTRFGIFIIPGLIPLSRLFSQVSGWGLFLSGVALLAWLTLGWQAAVAFLGGRIAATVANIGLEMQRGRYYLEHTGQAFTGAEVNFFSAYRLHAQAVGQSTNIEVAESEQAAAVESLARFSIQHPEMAVRFS